MASRTRRLDRSLFLRELKKAFPELRSAVNQEYGLLHLEIHAFRDFAQAAIDRGDEGTTVRAYMLAERFFVLGNNKMVNAIAVSFIEHLEFTKGRSWAWQLLPAVLKPVYEQLCGRQPI